MGEVSIAFVCALGISTVFIGLICIVLLCKVISLICGESSSAKETSSQQPKAAGAPATVNNTAKDVNVNRGEIVAAISAAIAEELGTAVTGIRIVSIKKI